MTDSTVYILGISAFYHDSAACLLRDGEIIAAAQEERFTRKKHDQEFPSHAVQYCLSEAGIKASDLNYVAFYDKPLLKFDRILETYLAFAPRGFKLFYKGLPQWLRKKLHITKALDRGLGGAYKGRYVFTEHHESHAASAFFPSPFEEAAILTLDGVGEWATSCIGHGQDHRMTLQQEMRFPHSLGLLYSAMTYFTGFRVNSGEYKLMGLAPYGEPTYYDALRRDVLDLKEDGSFRLNLDYFAYCYNTVMTSERMNALLDGPPRQPESPIGQREMDIAASIQKLTEDIMLRCAHHAHAQTKSKHLVMAGGVALNCVGNGRILREGPFDKIWIQPAAGDAGGALGAAFFVWHQLLNQPRKNKVESDSQKGSLLGPSFSTQHTRDFLEQRGARYRHIEDEDELAATIAELIASEKVVGHMAGRMEFGPRALGNRSILGDARSTQMQSVMNLKIKFRESFRPFAPVVLREFVDDYFEMRPREDSPYMLLVAPLQQSKRLVSSQSSGKGLERLKQARSVLPAITHVDNSARVQTVDAHRHPRLHRILTHFHAKTGVPVMVNTSFNVRSEPIVCSPEDAYRCFMATNMDALVIDQCLLLKEEQANATEHQTEDYLNQFQLD